jgi:hypothetical protein
MLIGSSFLGMLGFTPGTWDPASKDSGVTLSGGNLVATCDTSGHDFVRTAHSLPSKKIYCEITVTNANSGSVTIGISKDVDRSVNSGNEVGFYADEWSYRSANGQKENNSSGASFGSSYTTGDVIGIAVDLPNGKIWWAKNNTWQASGSPAAGTNPAFTGLSGIIYVAAAGDGSATQTITANFGKSAFTYSPPTGFQSGF